MILFVCSVLVVFVIVVSYCCGVVSLPPSLHPPAPQNLASSAFTAMVLPSFLPSSSPHPPPLLPFVHPLTSIFLSSVCVCQFCDVIPEDTDSPSWTNSGLSLLLLLLLLSFLTRPPLLPLLLSFKVHPPGLPSPTHLPSTQLSFLFPLRSPPFSCAVCALDCSIDDASLSFHILLFCCVQTVYAYSS